MTDSSQGPMKVTLLVPTLNETTGMRVVMPQIKRERCAKRKLRACEISADEDSWSGGVWR